MGTQLFSNIPRYANGNVRLTDEGRSHCVRSLLKCGIDKFYVQSFSPNGSEAFNKICTAIASNDIRMIVYFRWYRYKSHLVRCMHVALNSIHLPTGIHRSVRQANWPALPSNTASRTAESKSRPSRPFQRFVRRMNKSKIVLVIAPGAHQRQCNLPGVSLVDIVMLST